MTEPLLWSVALAGSGAALGFFFGATLLLRRALLKANLFLALFCLCFALLMVGDVLILSAGAKAAVWAGNALDWVFLMLAPLFYFYMRYLVSGVRLRVAQYALAFVPAAIVLLWFGIYFVNSPARTTGAGRAEAGVDFMPGYYTLFFVLTAVAQLLGYWIASYRLARAHAVRVEQHYSSVQKVDLRWVQALLRGAAIIGLFWIAGIAIQHPLWSALNAAMPPLMILTLGVLAQRQAPIAVTNEAPTTAQPESAAPAKYAKSGLTPDRMRAVAEQLSEFMASDKAFLESDLTLGQLAVRTGVPQHQISQVLNQHLGMSFFDYINRLRVEEVKRCLADAAFSDQSVLEIGLEAGFNSKAAFNAAFKKFAGVTPTAYRNQAS
jgi:AraC-like DNA-binding protein